LIPLNSSERKSAGIFTRDPEAIHRRVGGGGYSPLDGEKATHETRYQVRTVEVLGPNHVCGKFSRAKKILIRAQIGKENSNACSLASILLLLSSSDRAQTVVRSSANTPYDFWAEEQTFPAGDYLFDSGFPGSISIRGKGSKLSVAISLVLYAGPAKEANAKLLFVCRDEKYYLD